MTFEKHEKETLQKVLDLLSQDSLREFEETFPKSTRTEVNLMWGVRGLRTAEHLLRVEIDKLGGYEKV